MLVEGIGLIVMGMVYVVRPEIFQRILWPDVPVEQRFFSPEQNEQYMRGLGLCCIIGGLILSVLPSGFIHL